MSESPAITEIRDIAQEAGLRRVHVVAWRDLADIEAGGSEVHAAEWQKRWAEAGIDLTVRTSYAQGHATEGIRDGYRVIRRHGRFMVFPTTIIAELLRRTGPRDGLVEIWNGTPYLSPLWAGCANVTIVHHVHKDMWRLVLDDGLAPYGEFLERRIAPPFYQRTPLVALSNSTKAELVDYLRFRPEQISVVPPGIDPRYSPRGKKSPVPLIVSVGRLMAPKRFDELINISAKVRQRHPDLQLVIVGDGYERLALEEQVAAMHAESWIRIAGRVSDEELLALYRRAWVVASASIAEGWGMTLTEAAACGTPAIATRINGHTDSVLDHQSGLLANSSRELGEMLDLVLTDTELRARLGEGAKEFAAQLTWDATALGVLRPLADQALRRHGRAGTKPNW
ncbi:MAG: glycosyltransferase family 4 protein [Actinomycetes bacterium]